MDYKDTTLCDFLLLFNLDTAGTSLTNASFLTLDSEWRNVFENEMYLELVLNLFSKNELRSAFL